MAENFGNKIVMHKWVTRKKTHKKRTITTLQNKAVHFNFSMTKKSPVQIKYYKY